jgi:hypothetical protein
MMKWVRRLLIGGCALIIVVFLGSNWYYRHNWQIKDNIYFTYDSEGFIYVKGKAGGEVIVDPKVSNYEVKGKFVVGERVRADRHRDSFMDERVPFGFFYINTETMEVKGGLTKEELDRETAAP